MPNRPRLSALLPWALMALALIYRLWLMRFRYAVAFDEVNYLKLAATAAQSGPGAALHPFWPPLWPWALSLAGALIRNFELGGRLLSVACGMALLPLLYITVRRWMGERQALITLVWAGFAPAFTFQQTAVLTEPLYTVLALSGMLLGWRALTEPRLWRFVLTALLFGLTYLTRPEGIGFVLVFWGLLALKVVAQAVTEHRLQPRRLIPLALVPMVFVLTASPYWVFLHSATGHWTLSGKTANLQGEAYAMTRKADDVDVYRLLSEDNRSTLLDRLYHEGTYAAPTEQAVTQKVRLSKIFLVRKYVTNVYKVLKESMPSALSTVLFVLVALGLFSQPWDRERFWREGYLAAFVVFFWFGVMPFFHLLERHYLPLLPICYIWASGGVVWMADWARQTLSALPLRNPGRWAWGLVVGFMGLGFFVPELGRIVSKTPADSGYWGTPVEQKTAGLWLKDRLKPGEGIMSRGHTVDYYAGNTDIRQSVDIPLNELDRIQAYARYKGVRYLLIDERYIVDNPNMRDLLEGTECPSSLRRVYQATGVSGLRTVIYEFLDEGEAS